MNAATIDTREIDAYARRLERLGIDLDAPDTAPKKVPTRYEAFASIAAWLRAQTVNVGIDALRKQALARLFETDTFDKRVDVERFEKAVRQFWPDTFRLLRALDRLARPRGNK